MQGLAVVDCFTYFCSYGLEPIFQRHYIPFGNRYKELYYPYCSLYSNVNLLLDTLYLTSVFLTSCLVMQKVIVILFPIWSMNYLTIKKRCVLCVVFYHTNGDYYSKTFYSWIWLFHAWILGVNGEAMKLLQSHLTC